MIYRSMYNVAFIFLAASASTFATETVDSNTKTATPGMVSIESLLGDMIDRDSIASYPEKNFRLKQASSYNRASKTPDEPKGWFKNKDYNGHFVRVEEKMAKKNGY